ncbi:hypothetical protein BSL78_25931 [Apostichopus japonicus]|uniref:Uncharacterized protein n=1 Tax=Stichopus japonicus TaxID=307972 RepID=A0A2G8JNE2_STIJA|nr:hypothetical protein BSL78_25931 [Apostichopus japonicus]
MEPPSKPWNSRKQYKGQVKAKVAAKRNDVRKKNADEHYYAARIRYRLEFGREFADSTIVMSADCINKLAVSRYRQIRRIFPNDDRPNVPDHDFPISKGYKITPSGYMVLKSKPSFKKTTQDKLGREVYQFPRTGPAFVFNRVAKFRKVEEGQTVEQKEEKEVIVIDTAMDRCGEYWKRHGI